MAGKTELGIFLSKLRVSKGDLLRDMAVKLNVSSAFLSAVENGKKKMPEKWFDSLKQLYGLSENEMEQLKTADIASSDKIELNLSNVFPTKRDLAVTFAREFDNFDEETSKKLIDYLNKHKEG